MESKALSIAPLTGTLDLRSPPNDIPAGGVRFRQNLQTIADRTLRRGSGWSKLLSKTGYNNTDLHDQLLVFTASIRQPITMLYQAESSRKVRSLIAATQSTIYKLNEHAGNWTMLGTDFGGTATISAQTPRFHAARVGDYVLFTNSFDAVRYHVLEQGAQAGPLLSTVPDLETIGLTRASVIWEWRNCIFLADVDMDQQRYAYRLLWSDYQGPISFDPAKAESITGSKDLQLHERILAGRPAGNSFLIYTTHGIWEMSAVGGDQSFDFRRVYNGDQNKSKVNLFYPNTLTSLGEVHAYMAEDGIYAFNQFYSEPERVEWLHRASQVLYDNIDKAACNVHVAAVHGDEVLFSVAKVTDANDLPSITLRAHSKYQVADVVDAGFTALCDYSSQDVGTIRDFIVENEICTLDELKDAGYGYGNEGLPTPLPEGDAEFTPQVILTHSTTSPTWGEKRITSRSRTGGVATVIVLNHFLATGDHIVVTGMSDTSYNTSDSIVTVINSGAFQYASAGSGEFAAAEASGLMRPLQNTATVEDFNRYPDPGSDSDSLCALLGPLSLDDLCRGCEGPTLFVAASSADWCIKQLGSVFYRERCTNPTGGGTVTGDGYVSSVGTFVQDGITSILRPRPLFVENGMVQCEDLRMDYIAAAQTPPSGISLRVGTSAQPKDPNIEGCGIVWYQHSTQELKCQSPFTMQQHLDNNSQPSIVLSWPFLRNGRYLYFELTIAGVGGDAIFSGLLATAKQLPIRNL